MHIFQNIEVISVRQTKPNMEINKSKESILDNAKRSGLLHQIVEKAINHRLLADLLLLPVVSYIIKYFGWSTNYTRLIIIFKCFRYLF